MIPYKENNNVGNELLPIQLYKVEMNKSIGVKIEMVSGFGSELITKKSSCTETLPHWHTYLEILCFIEGNSEIQINDKYFEVYEGDIVLLDSLDIHSLKGNCKHIAILIDLSNMQNMKLINASILPYKAEDKVIGKESEEIWIKDKIIENINSIFTMYESKLPGYYFNILSRVYDMLGNISLYCSQKQSDSSCKLKKDELEKVELILNYIDKNYTEDISLEEAAKVLNFSSNYFCRFFKRSLGKTFFEYVNFYRCTKAEILLNTTDKTITEIALEVGFNSVSYFDKTYRKYKGCKPSEERIIVNV